MQWLRLKSNSGRWAMEAGTLRVYLNGSENYSDWVRNFAVGRRQTPQGYVNRVDHREALATIRELRAQIAEADSVIVAGHSRGASEALAMAQEIRAKGKRVSALLFAPKRTGCRDYTDESLYIAYRHRGDWVPFLPPWYAGYKNIVFGQFKLIWIAHEPREYYDRIKQNGF